MRKRLLWWKECLEYLGGARDVPPKGLNLPLSSPWWGLGWGVVICLIAMCCGQTAKFIYLNF